jgi:thiamine-phosphate pyrophosphorylase
VTTNELTDQEYRIIDANLNRLNEGIRVVEDIFRYALNHKHIATELKQLRHSARVDALYEQLLNSRDVDNDVLRPTQKSELNRSHSNDIIIANFKRAQEASRVLEELLKLADGSISENFKHIRYELYKIEKKAIQTLSQ